MTAGLLTPLGAGALAGLGVALPLGAIGVLIVQEGINGGWRPAAAAGTGVAIVDGGYAVLAVAAGAAVTGALAGRERAVQLVGAAVLLAVAAAGSGGLARGGADGVRAAGGGAARPRPAAVRRADRVNPMTALYFVVLTAGLGSVGAGPGGRRRVRAGRVRRLVGLAADAWRAPRRWPAGGCRRGHAW